MPREIFLAAPESSAGDLGAIDKLLVSLEVVSSGRFVPGAFFVPHLAIGDVGVDVDAAKHFTKCLSAVQEAKLLVALLDGPRTDDGVAFLVAYAFAAGKPVVGYRTDRRLALHPLVETACSEIVGDVKSLAAALAARLP